MTLTDYILDIGLIALVLVQVRERRLTVRNIALPILVVGWAATNYLKGVPTSGGNLVLIALAASIGVAFGIISGLFTRVRANSSGSIVAKAGTVAAIFWVLGVGTRMAFQLYATNGGGASIYRFSVAHHISVQQGWTAALILMAIGEVAARTVAIGARAYAVSRTSGAVIGRWGHAPLGGPSGLSASSSGGQDGWQ